MDRCDHDFDGDGYLFAPASGDLATCTRFLAESQQAFGAKIPHVPLDTPDTRCKTPRVLSARCAALFTVGQDGMWEQVDPKAITSDKRYAFMVKSECKDGAVAVTMRNITKLSGAITYTYTNGAFWMVTTTRLGSSP